MGKIRLERRDWLDEAGGDVTKYPGIWAGDARTAATLGSVPAACMVGPRMLDGSGPYDPVTVGAAVAWVLRASAGIPVEFTAYRAPAVAINGLGEHRLQPSDSQVSEVRSVASCFADRVDLLLRTRPDLAMSPDATPEDPDCAAWYGELCAAAKNDPEFRRAAEECVPKGAGSSRPERYVLLELAETCRAYVRGVRIKVGYKREKKYDDLFREIAAGAYPSCASVTAKLQAAGADPLGSVYWDERFVQAAARGWAAAECAARAFDWGSGLSAPELAARVVKKNPFVCAAAGRIADRLRLRPDFDDAQAQTAELVAIVAGSADEKCFSAKSVEECLTALLDVLGGLDVRFAEVRLPSPSPQPLGAPIPSNPRFETFFRGLHPVWGMRRGARTYDIGPVQKTAEKQ